MSVSDLYIPTIGLPILLEENVSQSWECINRSLTHECGYSDWGRAIPFLEVHKWDFRCSALWYDLYIACGPTLSTSVTSHPPGPIGCSDFGFFTIMVYITSACDSTPSVFDVQPDEDDHWEDATHHTKYLAQWEPAYMYVWHFSKKIKIIKYFASVCYLDVYQLDHCKTNSLSFFHTWRNYYEYFGKELYCINCSKYYWMCLQNMHMFIYLLFRE